MSQSRRTPRIVVALAALAAAALAAPAVSSAAPLSMEQARAEAVAAVAPLATEKVLCLRQSDARGGAARRRAVCLVAHPAAEGSICRSFVIVTAPRGRVSAATPVRAQVAGHNVCLSVTGPRP